MIKDYPNWILSQFKETLQTYKSTASVRIKNVCLYTGPSNIVYHILGIHYYIIEVSYNNSGLSRIDVQVHPRIMRSEDFVNEVPKKPTSHPLFASPYKVPLDSILISTREQLKELDLISECVKDVQSLMFTSNLSVADCILRKYTKNRKFTSKTKILLDDVDMGLCSFKYEVVSSTKRKYFMVKDEINSRMIRFQYR